MRVYLIRNLLNILTEKYKKSQKRKAPIPFHEEYREMYM